MFDRATKKLVRQLDHKGALIAASRLNDSGKLQALAVVLKTQKSWFWQQTKYKPTGFKLNDLLEGDPIKPVCEEKEFVKFKGEYRNSVTGSIELGGSAVSLNAIGQGTSKEKLSLSIGTLKKEDVDIPSLVTLIRGRKLDLKNSFFKQSPQKNMAFTIIKERIFTAHDCSISYTELEKASCHAAVGFGETYIKESGELQCGSKTALHIPPDTVMAYSVIEMTIESDGYFDLCIWSSGLESDDISQNPFPNFSEVDGQWPLIQEGFPLTTLKKALADVQTSFCALADLSAESRSSILLLLREILTDRSVLSALVERLEVLSSSAAPCFLDNELSEKQSQIIGAFLDLLKGEQLDKSGLTTSTSLSSYNGCQISTANHRDSPLASELNGSSPIPEEQNGCHKAVSHQNGCSTKASRQSMELMNVMEMLINSLDELTDAGLDLLEPFCTSEGLQSLQDVVIHLTTSDMPSSKDTMPVFLQSDNEFHRVEELFKSCNVLLRKENDMLTSEITCREGFLPMVLCIAIHGLASFVSE
ncbi:non-syndromic hearing impairment protein 5-like [Sinocyclocheilus anshuiensis]|uniref:Non-syndromic hearing impairment protein 5-like n=1 Tax=Sinocyclocheilus anshuiensis TaxID=1608454 RepID=A0A671M430_9TELE|nr:PREDICTED: non-syndromic hearing impairment protein 5-like [Sinocyclocheilus anshuiensis]